MRFHLVLHEMKKAGKAGPVMHQVIGPARNQ